MSVTNIDFRNRQKNTLPVTLHDGRTLKVKFPTKALLETLQALDLNDLDASIDTVAEIISNNTEGVEITTAQLTAMGFDLDDAVFFVTAFTTFISDAIEQVKNASSSLTTQSPSGADTSTT